MPKDVDAMTLDELTGELQLTLDTAREQRKTVPLTGHGVDLDHVDALMRATTKMIGDERDTAHMKWEAVEAARHIDGRHAEAHRLQVHRVFKLRMLLKCEELQQGAPGRQRWDRVSDRDAYVLALQDIKDALRAQLLDDAKDATEDTLIGEALEVVKTKRGK